MRITFPISVRIFPYFHDMDRFDIATKPTSREKSLIKEAVEKLSAGKGTGLILLKVLNSNGYRSFSFTESFCDAEAEPETLFYFLSIFRRGALVLKSVYDQSVKDFIANFREKQALDYLLRFLDTIDALSKRLAFRWKGSKTEWTLQLCKHLLQQLGCEEFIIDEMSAGLGKSESLENRTCPCCQEDLSGGSTGNTFIGHNKVWHGRTDIVLKGLDGKTTLPVIVSANNYKQSMAFTSQILAETIVFSFFIKKRRPDLKNFLIPTVTITRDSILFTFYDTVEDILIQSENIKLFENVLDPSESPVLRIEAVVALWLVMNYKLFCSGVCLDMKETGYTSNFLGGQKALFKDVEKVYIEELQFGIDMQSENVINYACDKDGKYYRVVQGDN